VTPDELVLPGLPPVEFRTQFGELLWMPWPSPVSGHPLAVAALLRELKTDSPWWLELHDVRRAVARFGGREVLRD
jgi:hypothetical protein